MIYLQLGEIVLAVILTVLALAILAILVARWTRRRNNGAGLLDHEDGVSRGRLSRGRGSRCSFSSDSGLCRSTPGRTRSTKSLTEPLTGNAGDISGTIGPIMQFSAPIPGATGPIKLSQKTFLQTPGPIVQCMDSSESCSPDGSNAGIPVDMCCQPALKPSCCQQLSIKPSCCQPAMMPTCCPPEAPSLPLLITQRASTKRGPPIILKKRSDCKGMRHGGSVTFQDECGNPIPIKCCKEVRRCQCQYCCPKRCEMVHQRQPIWCEEPAPSSSQQHPPRRQDSQVRNDQRNDSEHKAQTICYEEPFLFRRLESLIRRNQDGIVIKQNEGGFLIKKALDRPSERRKKRKSSKKSEHQETDSDSSAPKTTEDNQDTHGEKPEGEERKHKKEKKKKKKKDKDG